MKTPREIQDERYMAMLRQNLGSDLLAALEDPGLTDFMRNPDGACALEVVSFITMLFPGAIR